MKALLRKIPAMIAMPLTLVSFVWYAMSLLGLGHDEMWHLSALMAAFCMLFFLMDALISLIRAIKKDDARFNYILTLVLVGAVPMLVIFGGDGKIFFNIIWNIYYLMLFVLEAISIKKAWVAMKAARKKAKETAE